MELSHHGRQGLGADRAALGDRGQLARDEGGASGAGADRLAAGTRRRPWPPAPSRGTPPRADVGCWVPLEEGAVADGTLGEEVDGSRVEGRDSLGVDVVVGAPPPVGATVVLGSLGVFGTVTFGVVTVGTVTVGLVTVGVCGTVIVSPLATPPAASAMTAPNAPSQMNSRTLRPLLRVLRRLTPLSRIAPWPSLSSAPCP